MARGQNPGFRSGPPVYLQFYFEISLTFDSNLEFKIKIGE